MGSRLAGKQLPGGFWGHLHDSQPQPTILLNLNEVAAQLRWTRRSVERQVAERRLRTVLLGRSVRVERTELDRFVAAQRDTNAGHLTRATKRNSTPPSATGNA